MKRSRESGGSGNIDGGGKLKLHLNRPVLSYLRDSTVEVVDDEDMRSLYSHQWGYIGKGTVSRRMPNRAMLVPPELIEEFMKSQSQSGVQFGVGSDTRKYDERDKRIVSSAAISLLQPCSNVAKVSLDDAFPVSTTAEEIPTSIDDPKTITSSSGNPDESGKVQKHYEDILTRYAHDFEGLIAAQPLPDAFLCASVASAHSHELHPFEVTRSFAHYVSSPPPRLRHILPSPSSKAMPLSSESAVSEAEKKISEIVNDLSSSSSSSLAKDSSSISISDKGVQLPGTRPHHILPKPSQLVQITHVVFETSIVEPEAAVYALSRSRGRFIVLPSTEKGSTEAGTAIPTGLSIDSLWKHFCERMLNFPARAAFYAHARDTGFVVRDGHAFGSDFELYPHGPGVSHGTVCVIVMPLGVRRSREIKPLTSDVKFESGIRVPRPHESRVGVMKNWVQAHAHGRVIGTVRKAFALAYSELLISQHQDDSTSIIIDDMSSQYYPEDISKILSDPDCALGTERIEMGSEVNDLKDMNLKFSDAKIKIKLHSLSRWQVNLEHNKKKSTVMQQIALTEAEVFASHDIDISEMLEKPIAVSKQAQKINMRKLLERSTGPEMKEISNTSTSTKSNRNQVILLDLSSLTYSSAHEDDKDEDPVNLLAPKLIAELNNHKSLLLSFKESSLFRRASIANSDVVDERNWYKERSEWVKNKSTDHLD
jgi:hypothetical protein